MTTAIIPGSFDPMTLGHRDIVLRASRIFDKIIVAIMVNPQKKGRFSFNERRRIAELTLADIENVSILTSRGYLADLAAELGVIAIVKGIRNTDDLIYEQEMAIFNHERNPACETVYLPSYGDMKNVSSTAVRNALNSGESISGMMHKDAENYIRSIIAPTPTYIIPTQKTKKEANADAKAEDKLK